MIKLRLWCLFLLLLCGATAPVHTQTPASELFVFTSDLLQAAHQCAWARDNYDLTGFEESTEMMTTIMNQSARFEKGSAILEKYLQETNKNSNDIIKQAIFAMAFSVVSAIEIHVATNTDRLEMLRKISNGDMTVTQDFNYKLAQLVSAQEQAWEMMSMAIARAFPLVLVELKEDAKPTDTVSFVISERERKSLLEMIDRLFGDELKRFSEYRELAEKGIQGNPDDQTWLIFAISRVHYYLTAEKYQDLDTEDWVRGK